MNWRAEVKFGQRIAFGPCFRRSTACALCVSASWPTLAIADGPSPTSAVESSATRDFPKRLAITVVADEQLLGTFQQRVSSWFSDGTEVVVTVRREVDQAQLLEASPGEVRAWIFPLASGDALLSFSCVSPPAAPRHLVREVRLHSGFDELGLERLASVVHSAFVALSQGVEGVARQQAERELGAVGVAVGVFEPPNQAPPSASFAPVLPAPPAASAGAPPTPPAPATANVAAVPRAAASDRAANRPPPPPWPLLVAAGYGVRLRGPEGFGHGPSLVLGVQLPGARTAFDLQLSGQYLFSSDFDAAPFSASVQTSALRVQVGIEPQLKQSLFAQVLLGVGADIARISARASSSSAEGLLLAPHASGTQARSMGELSLGVMRHGEVLDVGIVAQVVFSFQELRYSATTSEGDATLVQPWAVQPALSLQGRFRSAL